MPANSPFSERLATREYKNIEKFDARHARFTSVFTELRLLLCDRGLIILETVNTDFYLHVSYIQ